MQRTRTRPDSTRQGSLRSDLETRSAGEATTEPKAAHAPADAPMLSALNRVRRYIGEHPWIILGGFAALMLVVGALSRGRP